MENEAIYLIDKIATKLGTTAEYLFGILVKQAPFAALQSTVIFIVVCIAVIVAAKNLTNKYKKLELDDVDTTNLEFTSICLAIVAVIILIFTAVLFYKNLCGFYNPEYWALQSIINQL